MHFRPVPLSRTGLFCVPPFDALTGVSLGQGEVVMKTIRRIFWLVMAALLLLNFVSFNLNLKSVGGGTLLAMIVWWFVGMFFSRIIGSMIVSSVHCKGCGLEIPAVAQWRIGSYADHRERHFLYAKNPVDGTRLGQINCPQCSCTIVL